MPFPEDAKISVQRQETVVALEPVGGAEPETEIRVSYHLLAEQTATAGFSSFTKADLVARIKVLRVELAELSAALATSDVCDFVGGSATMPVVVEYPDD
jgi:hypothetical protein